MYRVLERFMGRFTDRVLGFTGFTGFVGIELEVMSLKASLGLGLRGVCRIYGVYSATVSGVNSEDLRFVPKPSPLKPKP